MLASRYHSPWTQIAPAVSNVWPEPWEELLSARMVVIASPGGIEEILRLIAKGGDIDIMALSEKFGVRRPQPVRS
jgi:hypothetical protein